MVLANITKDNPTITKNNQETTTTRGKLSLLYRPRRDKAQVKTEIVEKLPTFESMKKITFFIIV